MAAAKLIIAMLSDDARSMGEDVLVDYEDLCPTQEEPRAAPAPAYRMAGGFRRAPGGADDFLHSDAGDKSDYDWAIGLFGGDWLLTFNTNWTCCIDRHIQRFKTFISQCSGNSACQDCTYCPKIVDAHFQVNTPFNKVSTAFIKVNNSIKDIWPCYCYQDIWPCCCYQDIWPCCCYQDILPCYCYQDISSFRQSISTC
ncbi:hypothetical protein TRIUR3_00544 [Triticum urartu]|uniref:Uncharacterized protein n=1 Tax=Triticum urartu TaxID=4572 RepID=M8AHQ0_TRIUA|nr:hypothetical protein TRIUR3_00544 [Triticum urartu]